MGKTIGIDIGDTYFRVSYLDGLTPKLVKDGSGNTVFPSKVSFLPGGKYQVGYDAEMFGIPENTVIHPMTIAGLPFSQLQRLNHKYVCQFFLEGTQILIDAHRVYPTVKDVLVAILLHAKNLAEADLKCEVTHAVIAVPDGSNDPKRKAIKAAAEEAGLIVKQLFNQAISAVLGYRFDRHQNTDYISVIDIGAAHSAFSYLRCGAGNIEVLSTKQVEVGINNMKWRLVELIARKYQQRFGFNVLTEENYHIRDEVILVVDQVFPEFSYAEIVTVSIGAICPNGGRFIIEVSRQELEQAMRQELQSIFRLLTNEPANSCNLVVLIGGGAEIPIIKDQISQHFHKRPFCSNNFSSAEAVAYGAAIKGGIIDRVISSQTTERITHDLGTFYQNDLMDVLIPAGTIFPYSRTKRYGMRSGSYLEKVYQFVGLGSGQDKRESDPEVIILGTKTIPFVGRSRGRGDDMEITFSVDADMVATFVVKDLGNGKEYTITDFSID